MAVTEGPLLAEGKDAQIFDLGDGLVLRRARDRRSLAREAAVMTYARQFGVPVPAVHEVTEDGAIAMDRVDGPTVLRSVLAGELSSAQAAQIVVDMHELVNAVPAPSELPARSLPGDRLLHLDLHVLNIVLTPDGPILLDWANASAGPPQADLAMTWFLHGAGPPDEADQLKHLRRTFLIALRPLLDTPEVRAVISDVAQWRIDDRNVGGGEAATIAKLCESFPELP